MDCQAKMATAGQLNFALWVLFCGIRKLMRPLKAAPAPTWFDFNIQTVGAALVLDVMAAITLALNGPCVAAVFAGWWALTDKQ
jgi:uncharacterized membrane protein HdeD (DUF308 family)